MADTSKLGTILILAVICVGVLLVVSSGISAWQNYQSIAEPDTPAVVPTLVSTPEVPVTATATATGSDRMTPAATTAATVSTPVSPATTPASPAATTVSSPVVTTPVATPAATAAPPLSAPAADDPILGTWTGTKSVSLFFVSANGQGTVTFRDDFTGELSGAVHGAGMDETFASGFVWTNNGGGSYTGSIGTESMGFTLAGETLTMTINPKKLGLNAMLDMDIPVEMHRV
ncbi:MAG: hypothetical protein O0X93_08700 [Methanocorpusculum sp.]|nr:hypothetical protein [Methanocorpusculum sp.]MDE2523951.1 hypothetical protein [Methanocorpusculum sp.]